MSPITVAQNPLGGWSSVVYPGVDAEEMLSDMFMNDVDDGTEVILSKSVDDRRD